MPATCTSAEFPASSLPGLRDAQTRRIITASLLSIAIHTFVAWYLLAGHKTWSPLSSAAQTLEVSLLSSPTTHPDLARKATPLQHKATRQASAMPIDHPAEIPLSPISTTAAQTTPTHEDTTTSAAIAQESPGPLKEVTHTAPLYEAAYLHNPPPLYPLSAKRRGMEGRVTLRAEIQPDGKCSRIELKQSSGWEVLDQAALNAVRAWRFEPARQGKQAIVAWVAIPVTFKLDN